MIDPLLVFRIIASPIFVDPFPVVLTVFSLVTPDAFPVLFAICSLGPVDLFTLCFKTDFDHLCVRCASSFLSGQDSLPVLYIISSMVGTLTHDLPITFW